MIGAAALWAQSAFAALTAPAQEIEAQLTSITAGAATLEVPVPAGKRAPTNQELAAATGLAIEDPAGVLGQPAQTPDAIAQAGVLYRPSAAPVIARVVTAEILDGGADGPITSVNKFTKQQTLAGKTLQTMMQAAGISSMVDPAAGAAAITANAICAVEDTGVLTVAQQKSAYKKLVTKAVRSVRSVVSAASLVNVPDADDPTMQSLYPKLTGAANGGTRSSDNKDSIPNDGKAPSKAVAGVVTGAVTEIQDPGSFASNTYIKAVIQAAVLAAPESFAEIAQAAATAAAVVFGDADLFATQGAALIRQAVKVGLGTLATGGRASRTKEAVAFGIAEAKLVLAGSTTNYGAGAQGVANYSWNNRVNGSPVTDTTGF